jgi:hypothetical protein
VRVKSFDEASTAFLHRMQIDTDTGNLTFWVEGSLPAAQTVFYRPNALLLELDERGGWPERLITFRLPTAYPARLTEESIRLVNCGNSKIRIAKTQETADHIECTVSFLLSPTVGCDWQGGIIQVCIDSANLEIPVNVACTSGKAGG